MTLMHWQRSIGGGCELLSDIGYICKKEGVYMSCLKVNNIYIGQVYAYIPEAQECMQPLHSHVNIH